MHKDILDLTEKLVPISDFSKGKTSQIFDDVKERNAEYIVLKNNQPTALLISLQSYRDLVEKASKMEELLEEIEEERLLKIAEERMAHANLEDSIPFEDVVKESGFTMEEIYEHMEEADIE